MRPCAGPYSFSRRVFGTACQLLDNCGRAASHVHTHTHTIDTRPTAPSRVALETADRPLVIPPPTKLAVALRRASLGSKARRSPPQPGEHEDAEAEETTARVASRAGSLLSHTPLPAPASRAAHPTKCAGLCGAHTQWVAPRSRRGRGGTAAAVRPRGQPHSVGRRTLDSPFPRILPAVTAVSSRQAARPHHGSAAWSCWRSGSRRTTGMSVAYATATTCCAAGARAVGTRRGDGPSRGLAPKADGWGNKWWVRWRGASASSEVPLRR